jgi:hypothetical protein
MICVPVGLRRRRASGERVTRVLEAPVVVVGARDAAWLAEVLDMVIASDGHCASMPALREPAAALAQDHLVISGRASAGGRE